MSAVDDLIAWLVGGCRSVPDNVTVMTELCERLVACGVSLARGALFIRTLHPEIMGRRVLWKPGEGSMISAASFEYMQDPGYTQSPIVRVYETGQGLRRKLSDPDCPNDFVILDELREQGLTDYVVAPMVFSNGDIHVSTWCSAAPQGFTDAAIEILAAIEHIGLLLDDPQIMSQRIRAEAGINLLEGVGVSEAPRGTLFHHYQVDENGLIKRVNLLIATGQNNLAMNRTVAQIARHYIRGPHIPEGMLNRVEAGIRAFDPCLSCSTHAAGTMPLHIALIGPDGAVLDTVIR